MDILLSVVPKFSSIPYCYITYLISQYTFEFLLFILYIMYVNKTLYFADYFIDKPELV